MLPHCGFLPYQRTQNDVLVQGALSFGSMGSHTFPMFHVLICCSSKRSCSSLQTLSLSIKALQSAGWEKQVFTKCFGGWGIHKNKEWEKESLGQHIQPFNFWKNIQHLKMGNLPITQIKGKSYNKTIHLHIFNLDKLVYVDNLLGRVQTTEIKEMS